MSKLAYLVDMFCHLNNLNTSLQAWASEGLLPGGAKVVKFYFTYLTLRKLPFLL